MSLLGSTRTRIAAVAVAAAASGAGFAGVSAVTAGPATAAAVPASTVAAVTAGHHHHHARPWIGRLLARTDHATVEVKRHGSWVTLELDRGKVTAASASSVTLARPDGTSVTIKVTPGTKLRGVASAAKLVVGHGARVVSTGGAALLIGQHSGGGSKA